MNNINDFEEKISRLILSTKLPNEIKLKLNKVYEEYEEKCKQCSKALYEIQDMEILKIIDIIENDKEDTKKFINSFIEDEHEIKLINMMDKVIKEIDKNDSESKESNIEKEIKDQHRNDEFTNNIVSTIVDELNSSRKGIVRALEKNIREQKDEKMKPELTNIKDKWENDMKLVQSNAQKRMKNIKEQLQNEDEQIYTSVIQLANEYEQETKSTKIFRDNLTCEVKQNVIVPFKSNVIKEIEKDF